LSQNRKLIEVSLPLGDGSQGTVIAWLWARTAACLNPVCRLETPLVRSWWLTMRGNEKTYGVTKVVRDGSSPSGKQVSFFIGRGAPGAPSQRNDGTMSGRRGARCVACGPVIELRHVTTEEFADRTRSTLIAMRSSRLSRRSCATSRQPMAPRTSRYSSMCARRVLLTREIVARTVKVDSRVLSFDVSQFEDVEW